ncbi:small G-protein [Thecamonas trahens ATCC 50062]|uniref:Small G-protein n=1 Tax=Thecamonas trahens ATCC 50062 TaxID=461836 RepID=A0A0L0DFN0_THETB|nr:small G-protein [Thecamonas trahens ATCC 50062]KNC51122.1 small G-protein [Thecamonas trahens ATCC 50062]|eukprot:XP_013756330.1 small G-protein [Thecamonas trahens ATCC 50062]
MAAADSSTPYAILGPPRVGKTSLLVSYAYHQFPEPSQLAELIHDEVYRKSPVIDNVPNCITILDAVDVLDRESSIFYSPDVHAHGILCLYAVDDRTSFDALDEIIAAVRSHPEPLIDGRPREIVIVATKTDVDPAVVSSDEGHAKAAALRVPFVETSAKTRHGVDLAFVTLIRSIDAAREAHAAASRPQLRHRCSLL